MYFCFDIHYFFPFADLGAVDAQAGAAQSNTQQFEGISSLLVHLHGLFSSENLVCL
jgi:hypothetical protein